MGKQIDNDGLYRREHSPYWWGTFQHRSGQRIRRSTGETDKQKAKRIRARWIADEGIPNESSTQIGRTFDELMLAYLDEGRTMKGRAKTLNTVARDHGCIAALYEAFSGYHLLPADQEANSVMKPVLEGQAVFGYAAQRRVTGVSDATIRRELAILGSAISYANSRWNWGIEDVTRGRKPTQGEGRLRWITGEEATRLIQVAQEEPRAPHLADWIQVALHTGCRKSELLGLTWDRVDLQAGVIYLEAEHNKSRRRQSVPLNRLAREALVSHARFRAIHCPASPWVFCSKAGEPIRNIKRAFATACRRAQLDDFHPHDCRHTCASWLVMAGIPLYTVKEVLRHSSITVTEKYAHLAPENARDAVSVLADGKKERTPKGNVLEAIS